MDSSELHDIASCQAGDYKAFDPLYLRHVDKIYKYVFRRTLSGEVAEDITSQTFLKALESIRSFNPSKGEFRTWLYRIARNTLFDHFRRYKRTEDIETIWDLAGDEFASTSTEESIDAAALHKAMQILKPREREILLLRVWEGLSYKEIAEALDLTENNAKVIFSRTIGELRTKLPSLLLLILFPYSL
jgi:RNA polymerase sigma-70 factor (ECF subfamily)